MHIWPGFTTPGAATTGPKFCPPIRTQEHQYWRVSGGPRMKGPLQFIPIVGKLLQYLDQWRGITSNRFMFNIS